MSPLKAGTVATHTWTMVHTEMIYLSCMSIVSVGPLPEAISTYVYDLVRRL